MADSAPDPEVEDVLSSVRRLVSGEIPRKSRPQPANDGGALVLTAADRIEADPKARVEARSLEQRIAELEAAVDRGTEEFEPDGSEDQSQHVPDRIVYTRPPREEEAKMRRSTLRLSEIALIETGPANEDEDVSETPVQFRHERMQEAPVAEAPMAEDVPPVPRPKAELSAFSDPDDVVARIEARIDGGEQPAEVAESLFRASPPEESEQVEGEPIMSRAEPGPESDFDTALDDAVRASVETADTRDAVSMDEDWGDEGPEDFAGSTPSEPEPESAPIETAEMVSDAVSKPEEPGPSAPPAASTEAAPVEGSDGEAPEPAPKADSAEAALEALSDEEALRLLVGRLIREELQGELGERITRNVRKLVRREIMRALAARDLV